MSSTASSDPQASSPPCDTKPSGTSAHIALAFQASSRVNPPCPLGGDEVPDAPEYPMDLSPLDFDDSWWLNLEGLPSADPVWSLAQPYSDDTPQGPVESHATQETQETHIISGDADRDYTAARTPVQRTLDALLHSCSTARRRDDREHPEDIAKRQIVQVLTYYTTRLMDTEFTEDLVQFPRRVEASVDIVKFWADSRCRQREQSCLATDLDRLDHAAESLIDAVKMSNVLGRLRVSDETHAIIRQDLIDRHLLGDLSAAMEDCEAVLDEQATDYDWNEFLRDLDTL